MIEHDYKNILDEFDPTLDDAEIVELGKAKELISDELYMPIHISRDWVRCYVTTTQPDNFRMYVEGKSKRFLLSAKQFGDTFLISTYEDFPAAVQDVKPRRGYIAKVQQKTDMSYLVTLNHCHLCDDHLGFFRCGREHDEREVVAKVVHSIKKYHAINMDFKCLSVTIPAISENGRRKIWCPRSFRKVEPSLPMSADVNEGLFQCPTMGMKFVNKLPEWNAKLESLVLKFQGNRILTASAKNFLLYDEKYSKYDFAEAKVRQTVSRQESQKSTSAGLSRSSSNSAGQHSNNSGSGGGSNNNSNQSGTGGAAQKEGEAKTSSSANGDGSQARPSKPAVPRLPILQSLFAGRTSGGADLDDDDEEDRASARRSRQQQASRSSGNRSHRSGGNADDGDNSASPMSTYRSSDTAGYGGGGMSPPNTNRSMDSITPRSSRQQMQSNGSGQSQQQPQQSSSSSAAAAAGGIARRTKKAPPRPRDAADVAIMQFGKSSSTRFVLDFKYPLSPLQAFGIALSSFSSERIIRQAADKKKY